MKQLVPPDFNVPEILKTEDFHIRSLLATDLDTDYETVMSNIEHLRKTPTPPRCGDWPTPNLTKEQDLKDLQQHEEEHKTK